MVGYDASPALARVPLEPEDVEALLLTDARDLMDRSKLRHLLTRMRATFVAHAERVRSLQRDLERRADADRRRADPMLAALDSLAALTPQQQREVFDRRACAMVDAVERANAAASEARAVAANETNRARVVLGWAANLPGLTDEARAGLTAALEQVPLMRQQPGVDLPEVAGGFTVPPSAS